VIKGCELWRIGMTLHRVWAKTDNTQTTISGRWGGAFSAVTEPIYRYTNETRQKEQRIFKIVEVLSMQKVTDLGEME